MDCPAYYACSDEVKRWTGGGDIAATLVLAGSVPKLETDLDGMMVHRQDRRTWTGNDRVAHGTVCKDMMAHKIGLIGGLAVRAGIFYYEQLVQRFATRERVLELLLNHADVDRVLGAVQKGDRPALAAYLTGLADELFAGGASCVAITAIAPHLVIREVAAASSGHVVNALDTVANGLVKAGFTRVAVFGNKVVMDTNIFGAADNVQVVKHPPAVADEIHAIYTGIALQGKRGTQPEVVRLNEIASELIARQGVDAILLAGTDLSSFYAEREPEYRYLDVARLHIDEIVRYASRPMGHEEPARP